MRNVLVLTLMGVFVAASLSAGTITVDTTLDVAAPDGMCSLREAITVANNNSPGLPGECAGGDPGPAVDVIEFFLGGGGAEGQIAAIQPTSPLPLITDPVVIDGYSQPGSSPNTLAVGNDAVLLVELDGRLAGPGAIGLSFGAGSSPSEVRGLVINRFAARGIGAAGSEIRVQGNFIGTDRSGTAAAGAMAQGVRCDGAADPLIGGELPAERNVIAGSSSENLALQGGSGAVILGNYIGTDASGTVALGGMAGVYVTNYPGIGFLGSATAPNVISGHQQAGVRFDGAVELFLVRGNSIGADATLGAPLPNGIGLSIAPGIAGAPVGLRIGEPGAGNVIAYNTGDGIRVVGADLSPVHNTFSANSIFANGDLGIDLGDDGVTPNDPLDADSGPNNLQNRPTLVAVEDNGAVLSIDWSLDSEPSDRYDLEFFFSPECEPASSGVAQQYLGRVGPVSSDVAGFVSGSVSFPSPGQAGFVSSTAIRSSGDTSEISDCIPLGNPVAIPTLEWWGFVLLAALLALVGRWALRRTAPSRLR